MRDKNSKRPTLLQHAMHLGAAVSLGLSGQLAMADAETDTEVNSSGSILKQKHEVEHRVNMLLNIAADHIKDVGIQGVNDFNSDSRFTDKDLYVFSLSRDGVLLSSGGWSASLIGENVLEFTDEENNPVFQAIVDKAKTVDRGSVEYLWFNPNIGGHESKITYFQVVNNVIVASGYFPGLSTEEQAKDLLARAVSDYADNPEQAMRRFRNKNSGFRNKDQYVFLLDQTERKVLWSPTLAKYNNQPLDDVQDIQGTQFLAEMADSAERDHVQQVDYWWFSPISQRVELRRAFYQQVDGVVLAVATYVLPTD